MPASTFRSTAKKRVVYGDTVLFAPGIAISNIDNLTVATEQTLHSTLRQWVDHTIEDIQKSIERYDVKDTGATLASVYGVYPVPRSEEKMLRDGGKIIQKEYTSIASLQSYQAARRAAQALRSSLRLESNSVSPKTGRVMERDPKTGGRREARDIRQINSGARDTRFQPLGRVSRGNLYAGVGVATWYAIFPHEGLGFHEITGPRQFFVEPVELQQRRLVAALKGGLETTINGRLRQRYNGAVATIYRDARK